jgi:DNA-binding PadR family transcriptional regulator
MWVRAMQAVLSEIADMTTSDDDADKDREIEQTVLSYLQRHPQAADTLDGIVRWWLPQQRYSVAQARIEAALRRLVSQGLIRQRRLPTGDALYVRGEATGTENSDDNEQK